MSTDRHAAAQDALSALARPQTVLVVDDEESIRHLIEVMLELEGYRVLHAETGERALEIAAEEHLDLITLDVMMPGLDGWQVAEALDAAPQTASIPRMMVSGKPLIELESNPGRGRAAAVLAKPFDFAQFTELVRQLLTPAVLSAVPSPRQEDDPSGVL
ncbi:MAG: response regulator [Mycobacteriales bacterium]